MIPHYDLEQKTPEWFALRRGIPTASNTKLLVTPVNLALSASSKKYSYKLLAEYFLGESTDGASTGFMRRGSDMEARARAAYEWEVWDNEINVRRVGFIQSDDARWGGSPDGLVGEDGGLEVKILSAAEHVALFFNGLGAYHLQCHALMGLTGRKWWDIYAWNPSLPSIHERLDRNEKIIDLLDTARETFFEEHEVRREKLVEMGFKRVEAPPAQPTTDREFTADEQDWWASRGHAVAGQA